MSPYKTLDEWEKAVREAQAALDIALRGDLPRVVEESEAISTARQLCQRLDTTLFWGFNLLRSPWKEPRRTLLPNVTLEDLGL